MSRRVGRVEIAATLRTRTYKRVGPSGRDFIELEGRDVGVGQERELVQGPLEGEDERLPERVHPHVVQGADVGPVMDVPTARSFHRDVRDEPFAEQQLLQGLVTGLDRDAGKRDGSR